MKLLNNCVRSTNIIIRNKTTSNGNNKGAQFAKRVLKLKSHKSRQDNNITLKESDCKHDNTSDSIKNSSIGSNENENLTCDKPMESNNPNVRMNQLNLQMLPIDIYKHLFGSSEAPQLNSKQLTRMQEDFKKFDINTNESSILPDVNLKLPPLEGKDLEEHYYNIANNQIKPYVKIINSLHCEIPKMPEKWVFKEGWTRYSSDGIESVNYPLEDALIFDVEVCMNEGPLPTMATAVSPKAWYSWVSKSLIENSINIGDKKASYTPSMLIPIESEASENGKKLTKHHKKPKIVIGHNVSYDRVRIKEQYWLNHTGTRFLDTMSLHICVSGVNSYQRNILKSVNIKPDDEEWRNHSSLNGLSEVCKLYCNESLSKASRDEFVKGTLSSIREKFNDLMTYCASDVVATHNVFKVLYPLFQSRFQHPVTLAGMLELGTAYLPVNSNWMRYLEESESTFDDFNYEAKFILAKRADEVCKLMHNDKYKEDLWMWDQDWSTKDIKMKEKLTKVAKEEMNQEKEVRKKEKEEKIKEEMKYLFDDEIEEDPLEKKFEYLEDTKYYLPKKLPHMPGYPEWYRKLCPKDKTEDWWVGPENISTSTQITPKLLNLTWENFPLHYIKEHGWGFLVPHNDDPNVETDLPIKQLLKQCPLPKSNAERSNMGYTMGNFQKDVQTHLSKQEFWRYKKRENPTFYKGSGIWCGVDIDNCCWFFKLPHKDGPSFNVGNPLARDFLNKLSDNVLEGLDASANKVLKIARMVSYWRNNRNRILSQTVIWLDDDAVIRNKKSNKTMKYGAIIPQVISAGTLTRRAVESTWMTASNADPERIGSELRSMIQAPPGYNIVGADVDSQELWIASIIGDAYNSKVHGATPFGWMTLVGNKANGTDMHSMTAKASGISRDHAKIINYARIYGAGQRFAQSLLLQFNPTMTETEASSKSRKMFDLTKGKKMYTLKPEYVNDEFPDRPYMSFEIFKIAKLHGLPVRTMFGKGKWVGGSESAMFNRLEEIANDESPVTPFLNSRLSRALEGNSSDTDKYLPTKINWVVQSGAVDFLHLMLVSMRWLMRDNVRFCLSFHDDIRYLVASKHKYQAALAMHITNLMTRSFCALRLGMKDLPMSVAFFASVEVDTVLRKESTNECKTPSNPHGLENGYGIPPGESLNIWQAIEKTEGTLDGFQDVTVKKDKDKARKCKYIKKEVEEVFNVPTKLQTIVQITEPRGNNLHAVEEPSGAQYLVSMPTKYRKTHWVKKGDYVIVEPIQEGDKVKAEICSILDKRHIKFLKEQKCWPEEFEDTKSTEKDDDDDLFVNPNRVAQTTDYVSDSDSSESDD